VDSRTITNLTDDDAYDFGPVFSPDGKWIYYSSVRGTRSKIFRFHPETPESREQITYGDWNDDDPALSPDGKRLFFTSDRDAGINNIYSVNLETGETFLHTNVFAGAFCPTVFIGKDNTEKLVFSAYYKRRFTLYIADSRKPVQKLNELAPAASPTGPQGYVPYQPAIEVAIDKEKVTSRPSRKLQLEDASINAGVNTDQTFVSNTILVFGDNLGDRRFVAAVQSLSSYTNIFLQYVDLSKRLQKGIALFDDRQYYIGIDNSLGFDRAVRSRRIYRDTGGFGTVAYPVSRYSRVEGQLGYISRSIDYPISVDQTTGQIGFATLKNNFPIATVSFINDTTLYKEWGALAGRKFRLGYSYQYDLDKGKYGDFTGLGTGPTLSQDVSFEFRQYIKITDRSLFAFRVFGVRADGNLPNIYYFGGLDTLRGLDFRTAYGNTVGYANFEYRFPLIDYLAFPIGGFTNIRGHVFFDIGGAALKNQPFRFWDASKHQLINGIASYGWGLEVQLFGLQLHWDFARLTDLKQTLSGYRTSFFIGYEF